MELKATESMNTYFYMKSAIFYFQANNALQEKSIYIKLRDTTRPRIVFYYTFKKKKKSRKHFYLLFLFTLSLVGKQLHSYPLDFPFKDPGWLWTDLVQIKSVHQSNPVEPWSWLDCVWLVFTVIENEYELEGFLDLVQFLLLQLATEKFPCCVFS